ncbi:MAG: hypothetical protein WD069_16430 [Planctomycetales bacterium]
MPRYLRTTAFGVMLAGCGAGFSAGCDDSRSRPATDSGERHEIEIERDSEGVDVDAPGVKVKVRKEPKEGEPGVTVEVED